MAITVIVRLTENQRNLLTLFFILKGRDILSPRTSEFF